MAERTRETIERDVLMCLCVHGTTTNKQISEELNLPYVRVAVRLKGMRIRKDVISIQSNKPHTFGVKPLLYRQKE